MHQYQLEADQLEISLAEKALVVLMHTQPAISWGALGKALPEG